MEGFGEIEKIKKDTELLGPEAKLKALQEQSGSGISLDLALDEEKKIEQSDSSMINEEKEAIIDNMDNGLPAIQEGVKIKQVENSGLAQKKTEVVKQAIEENLNNEIYAPKQGIKINQAGSEEAQKKLAKRNEETRPEREEAVRKAFSRYAKMISDENIWGLLNVKDDGPEKGSVYYKQMRDAAARVKELAERLDLNGDQEEEENILDKTIVEQVPAADLVEAMTRLSETAHIYYDTHRGMRFFQKGENRKEACNKIRKLTELFFDQMGMDLNKEGMVIRREPDLPPGEDGAKAYKRLRELVKYYKKWKKHFAFNEADDRANVKAKADLFAVYEREMDIYRAVFSRNKEAMDPDVAEIIKEARYYKIQNSVLETLEKKGDVEGDAVHEMAKKHTDLLDYKETGEEELSKEEVDRDLSPEQLKAVEKIDRWFVRNYNNGGFVGRPINIKNHHGEIVSELMSRTKRERLFIYYLIETGARKEPKVFDAYASQTEYKPDLDKLKGQMLASKLKVMSRIMGGYVYMHKLTEALEINRDYKELIKDCARITRAEKEGNDPNKIEDPFIKRGMLLKKTYQSCSIFKKRVEECQGAKGSKKAALEAKAADAERAYKADLDALIAADNAVGEAVEKYGEIGEHGEKSDNNNTVEFKDNMDSYSAGLSKGGQFLAKGVNLGAATMDVLNKRGGGFSWRLEGTSLAKVEKYAHGYTASTISGLGHAMAMMYGIYNLYQNGGKMHAGDIGREVTNILKSGADSYISYRSGVELVGKYSKLIKDFDADKAANVDVSGSLKTASFITTGVGLMINAYNLTSGALDSMNSQKASQYLENKIKNSKSLRKAPEGETEEQKKERIKKLREVRYEKDMLKLSEMMTEHKVKYAGLDFITGNAGMLALTIPGLGGTILTAVGFIGGITVSILKAVDLGNIREAMFDRYFHFEEFMQKVKDRMDQKGRKIYDEKTLRERMRRKLAAAAGYSDMVSASNQIAKRYADQVCERLFGGNEVMPEDEKNGYIQLIKSFGLKYSEKKKIPDAKLLARKMTGR